jgi:hypothetical protein
VSSRLFYYNLLEQQEQAAYTDLARGLTGFLPEIAIAPLLGGHESIIRTMEAVLCDNPGLCFCRAQRISYRDSRSKITFHPDYLYQKNEAGAMQARMIAAADKIIAGIPAGASGYEREKYLHDWFVRNMRYQEGNDERGFHEAHSAIGPLLNNTGVCDGFAKAMTLLLRRVGLETVFVRGKSAFEMDGETGHAWNCVLLDGSYYHLDVTWDISLSNGGPVRYDYFNLSDSDIAPDHSDYVAPACVDTKHNYFLHEGFYAAGRPSLEALLAKMARDKAPHFTFKILPAKNGLPPDPAAVVQATISGLGIARYAISLNPYQNVVMVSDIVYW